MDYKKFTVSKNNKYLKKFLSVSAGKKLIFVPQCLRNIKKCRAKESGSFYICVVCGACKIASIMKAASDNGYMAVRILKGGSTVKKLVKDLKPEAILGVACYFEGTQGIRECERRRIPVFFYPLSKDGCENTDLKLPALIKMIKSP